MKQRHRKAYVVRRQRFDRLIRQIAARSVVRTMLQLVDGMAIKVFQRDADFRAQIYRECVEEMANQLQTGPERA